MPSSSQALNAQPDLSRRSDAPIPASSRNDERPKKAKKSKRLSEETRRDRTDSPKVSSSQPSQSSPSLPNHEQLQSRHSAREPKKKIKLSRHSHSVVVPETPQKAGIALEVERDQHEEIEEADSGKCAGARRKASLSLGHTPSPKVRQPHRQGVSRLHLTRDVKILPTVEKFPSLPRSSVSSTISQTSSEYTPGPSQSSCTSRSSSGIVLQPAIEDGAEVDTTHSRPGTAQGSSLFPDLLISGPFLQLPYHHWRVQGFKEVLSWKVKHIERETMVPLRATVQTCDAVEFQSFRDQIASSYDQLSYLLERYNTLNRAGLIMEHSKFFKRTRSVWRQCHEWLAQIDRASNGRSSFLTGKDHYSETQSHEWENRSKPCLGNGLASRKSSYDNPSTTTRADGTSASNNVNWGNGPPRRPRYFPVRKSLAQQSSLSGGQKGVEVQIPARNPHNESIQSQWIQDQAQWERRYRREMTAARIGGPYHTNPLSAPAAEPIPSDRVMSSIPPDEFYRCPMNAPTRHSDKLKHSSQNSLESRSLVAEKKRKNPDDSLENMADTKPGLAGASSLSDLSRPSQLSSFVTSTEHCSETSEPKKGKRKRYTTDVTRELSGHTETEMGKDSSASEVTAPCLNRALKHRKTKRKDPDNVPSKVPGRFENDQSGKPFISSRRTQPSGLDSSPSNAGQASVLEKTDRIALSGVNREPQSPHSPIASGNLSDKMTPGAGGQQLSSPEKRIRKVRRSHAKSDTEVSRDYSASSETSVDDTPASSVRSRKRRRDETLSTPSSSEKSRRKISHLHPEPSSHDGTADHISVEDVQSSLTPEPGPSTHSKGKARALPQNADEDENSHSRGLDDWRQDALQELSSNIQHPRYQNFPPVPEFHRSRFHGRDTPWLEDTVERKVKEILEKQIMPPPALPNSLGLRPRTNFHGNVPEGQGLTDEEIVAIIKNKSLSAVVRFARAPDYFRQSGSIRADYYYLKDKLSEEDWRRVGPKMKVRAPQGPNAT